MWSPSYARLACSACATEHARDRLQTVCTSCGKPLIVRLALDASTMPRAAMAGREASLWRYREVLPVARERAVTLAEGMTPLIEVATHVWVKDEARNPTGSFKARGMTLAVSAAKALGARALCAPSAGNAAGALAAYGARAGLPVVVAMPDDTPRPFIDECRAWGAEVQLVAGTIADAGKWLREHGPKDAFDVSTLKEPFRVEGKKTMAYELAEQMPELPDVIVYPTGGGTGLVGMWKAFDEMVELGWRAPDAPRPRLVSVQAAGCAPVWKGFVDGAEATVPWPEPATRAWGLRVPAPIAGFLCLRALRETHGTAVTVDEAAIAEGTAALSRQSGLDVCPEGGAAWRALADLRSAGWIRPHERVVVFNTGTGLKYR
jgi:threonine synthase